MLNHKCIYTACKQHTVENSWTPSTLLTTKLMETPIHREDMKPLIFLTDYVNFYVWNKVDLTILICKVNFLLLLQELPLSYSILNYTVKTGKMNFSASILRIWNIIRPAQHTPSDFRIMLPKSFLQFKALTILNQVILCLPISLFSFYYIQDLMHM
jgi:hypothetical protein